jgi:hypothetical protein
MYNVTSAWQNYQIRAVDRHTRCNKYSVTTKHIPSSISLPDNVAVPQLAFSCRRNFLKVNCANVWLELT